MVKTHNKSLNLTVHAGDEFSWVWFLQAFSAG